jgi:glycosyltransferase involved in cell wall biosynthesis/SAM-dependent methyltransferase
MRVAFFSPLPPARSGIADYSEALIESLRPLVDLEVFARADNAGAAFDPSRFDIALYQVGNNRYHDFVYETALGHAGVVVLHESNLHHLISDLTIRRDDWDGYLRECEYNGGAAARAYAERVRKLEVGPDYEGLPMTRRLLEGARGVVVHSRYMEREVRAAGFAGPVAVIPHGAWIPEADRNAWRQKLGLDELTPLIGIFGFLKPYKRIAESLRAFRRLVRLAPEARMILVGEPHPEFPLAATIRGMGLSASVRVLGFAPIEDFVGYLGACDIVLNLRYPTVGESSGTLLRSLGLGKAVMVSDVGSFQEFPEDVCLKVPVGAGEEDLIFEYMNLLVSRPEVAQALGANARDYVARECNWGAVARQYAAFLEAVAEGKEYRGAEPRPAAEPLAERHGASGAAAGPEAKGIASEDVTAELPEVERYLSGWAVDRASRDYLDTHRTRLVKTLEITPAGGPEDRVLEMGAYLQVTPALRNKLGYGEVRGCYYGPAGRIDHRTVTSAAGETFTCEIDHFDAEKDRFPYPDEHFSTVLCCELIEHLFADPMHLMSEVNRILKPGGHLVLTTPNVAALRGISAILLGYHPGFFHAYIKPAAESGEVDARHNREYTAREIHKLLDISGFAVARLETGEFLDLPHPEFGWVMHLLRRYRLETDLRGDGIYALGRKTGPVKERYPGWLYS